MTHIDAIYNIISLFEGKISFLVHDMCTTNNDKHTPGFLQLSQISHGMEPLTVAHFHVMHLVRACMQSVYTPHYYVRYRHKILGHSKANFF